MLHSVQGDTRNILQVEINTISSSFGALSSKIADMFQFFHRRNLLETCIDNGTGTGTDVVPPNGAVEGIIASLAAAHSAYISQLHGDSGSDCDSGVDSQVKVVVAMIVQTTERNFSDQRIIEYGTARAYFSRV